MRAGPIAALARGVPPSLRGDVDVHRRASLAIAISWFLFVIGLVLGVSLFVLSPPETRWLGLINTIVTCSLAALGTVLVRRGALVLAGHWIAGLIAAGVAYSLVMGGGVGAPFWICVPVPPVLALVIAGRRAGVAWGLVSGAVVAAIGAAQIAGAPFPELGYPASLNVILTVLGTIAVIFATLWVAAYSEDLKARAIRQIEEAARQRDRAVAEEEKARIAAEEAIAANAAKSTFLATMSHELRTPLNVILGYSEILEEELGDRLGEHVESVARIRGAGEHLLGVISDVLDLARIEADRLELRPSRFVVDDLVSELRATLEPLATQRGDRLVVEAPGPVGEVVLDKVRVRQILVNLVGNAIKFTEGGVITLGAAREPGGWVRFTVVDTGVGIPADRIQAIFEPFTQADPSSTRAHEGSGLGLTIVRRLARMMGGEVSLASTVGVGTRVEVRLPAEVG